MYEHDHVYLFTVNLSNGCEPLVTATRPIKDSKLLKTALRDLLPCKTYFPIHKIPMKSFGELLLRIIFRVYG